MLAMAAMKEHWAKTRHDSLVSGSVNGPSLTKGNVCYCHYNPIL
jgi:hypothetical protein